MLVKFFSLSKVFGLEINQIKNAKIVKDFFDSNEKLHRKSVFKVNYLVIFFWKNNDFCIEIKIRVESSFTSKSWSQQNNLRRKIRITDCDGVRSFHKLLWSWIEQIFNIFLFEKCSRWKFFPQKYALKNTFTIKFYSLFLNKISHHFSKNRCWKAENFESWFFVQLFNSKRNFSYNLFIYFSFCINVWKIFILGHLGLWNIWFTKSKFLLFVLDHNYNKLEGGRNWNFHISLWGGGGGVECDFSPIWSKSRIRKLKQVSLLCEISNFKKTFDIFLLSQHGDHIHRKIAKKNNHQFLLRYEREKLGIIRRMIILKEIPMTTTS